MSGHRAAATIIGLPELKGQFRKLSRAGRGDALKDAAMAGGQVVEAYARINANNVFSANATNALANSINTEIVEATDTHAEAAIGSNMIYARIHELGGIIKPVFAKMLHFVIDGVDVFAKSVQMPARPYLRPAMDEHPDEIRDAAGAVIKQAIERAL